MKTDELRAVRERVRAATGPDEALDVHVSVALGGEWRNGWFRRPGYEDQWWDGPDEISASIDAALALVQLKLPGWRVELWVEPSPPHFAGLYGPDAQIVTISHSTPMLALLDALLTALIDQQEPTHD